MTLAAGDVSGRSNANRSVCLLTAAVANTVIPSAATDGVPVYPDSAVFSADTGHCYGGKPAEKSTLLIKGTCTTGQTLVGTFTLWLYHAPSDTWYERAVNGGNTVTATAMAETDTDRITFIELISNIGHFDRVALQLTSIGGSGASFEAWLATAMETF